MGNANSKIKEMKLSSYQILKARKVEAEKEAQMVLDDLEAVVLQLIVVELKMLETKLKLKMIYNGGFIYI